MRNTRRPVSAVLGLLLAISFGVAADDTSDDGLGEIRAQQLELREAAQAGDGPFKAMDAAQREELVSRQTQLLSMIDGKQTVHDLDEQTRVAAYDLLQQINATVNDAEREQVVCRSVREIGSNRKVRHCTPVADRSREREAAQRALSKTVSGG